MSTKQKKQIVGVFRNRANGLGQRPGRLQPGRLAERIKVRTMNEKQEKKLNVVEIKLSENGFCLMTDDQGVQKIDLTLESTIEFFRGWLATRPPNEVYHFVYDYVY